MSQKLQLRRNLRVEGLETRTMLAGDVQVVVDAAGNLSIKGDLNNNIVQIAEIAPGEFEISNADPDPLTPTTFNGGLAGPILVPGVIGNVKIDLKQGNDGVQILDGANFPANLDIQTGHGNDSIGLVGPAPILPITIAGNLSVKSGQGDDFVIMQALAVGGNLEVDTSDGIDFVTLDEGSSVTGDAIFRLGHGDDFLGIGIAGGAVNIGGHLKINSSVGNDLLIIEDVVGTTAEIDTSDGIDSVTVRTSVFEELEVRLGLDDDFLVILDTTVAGTADLNGSGGIDAFVNTNNTFGTLATRKFEL